MREFRLYSLKSKNESGSGGFACCSGNSGLPVEDRVREADIAEVCRNASGWVQAPSVPGDVRPDRICPTMACVAA
jgi:hypothetical protein